MLRVFRREAQVGAANCFYLFRPCRSPLLEDQYKINTDYFFCQIKSIIYFIEYLYKKKREPMRGSLCVDSVSSYFLPPFDSGIVGELRQDQQDDYRPDFHGDGFARPPLGQGDVSGIGGSVLPPIVDALQKLFHALPFCWRGDVV